MAIEKEPTVADAEKAYEYLLTSDELRMLSEMREKDIHDEVTNLAGAREEGIQQGVQQGSDYKEETIAKNILMKNFTDQQIIDITGISPERLARLKRELTERHSI
ncbi:MAG: hypothetical protein Q7S39_01505 [Ignavibacteria bacterium]|nr:hypothetical protein [Ignavibacteria bacterium]